MVFCSGYFKIYFITNQSEIISLVMKDFLLYCKEQSFVSGSNRCVLLRMAPSVLDEIHTLSFPI